MVPPISSLGLTPPSALAPAARSAAVQGPSFEQTVVQAAGEAVETLQSGEAAAIEGVKGSLPAFKVVDSVMAAQRTLQQVLAIRDKAVAAYQEITKMSI
jgi:flagellar hook-basal body complex protein FliE